MRDYTIQEIAEKVNGVLYAQASEQIIRTVFSDSRNLFTTQSLFVAIQGERFDGHQFIPDLIANGCQHFLVNKQFELPKNKNVNFIQVEDTLRAFQLFAQRHRQQFDFLVIGITGSNGKTIVKEWLFQLLSPDYSIVKSPKSYNSQIGVAHSILQADEHHNLGVFEAGISTRNEMQYLAKMIQPTIGVFTTLGSAHNEGFTDLEEKLEEKLTLFSTCETIIVQRGSRAEQRLNSHYPDTEILSWYIEGDSCFVGGQVIQLPENQPEFYTENIAHCIATLVHLGIDKGVIEQRIQAIQPVANRLEVLSAVQGLTIINDSYNNDFGGLEIALRQAYQQAKEQPFSVLLSDFLQTGLTQTQVAENLVAILKKYPIHQLIGVGELFSEPLLKEHFNLKRFASTIELKQSIQQLQLKNEVLLIKGAREFHFEKITRILQEQIHDTVWEINLSAFIQNINVFKSLLEPNVKMMVMVKAFAYGTSPEQIAQLLQHQHIDYLGVAYPEEGKELRKFGIQTPIMVMNTSVRTFQTAVDAHLEIEVFSIPHLSSLIEFLKENERVNYPIHLKIDTGMHRLGFTENEIPELKTLLKAPEICVKGIFSHLAASDDENELAFTLKQQEQFDRIATELLSCCEEQPLLHLLNSNGIGISSLPQYDMVRLGIGAYGISANPTIQKRLMQIGTLKARISQIKEIPVGDSVGYARTFVAKEKTRVGTITIGYADGFDRRFSKGVGSVLINGKLAPVIGNVCMDMTMINLNAFPTIKEGDEVIITSPELPLSKIASWIDTIPYELLTKVSARIPRVFIVD